MDYPGLLSHIRNKYNTISPVVTNRQIRITAPLMSAEDNRIKMATGRVSVFKGIEPATVMVAPNSPTAFAQVKKEDAIIPLRA